MATRNPASVLPEPVGAAINVSRPAAISGQPRACGSVGPSGKRRRNHSATAGWNPVAVPPAGGAKGVSGAKTMPLMVRTGCDNHGRIFLGSRPRRETQLQAQRAGDPTER